MYPTRTTRRKRPRAVCTMLGAAGLAASLFTVPATAVGQSGSPAGVVPTEYLEARRVALLDELGTGVAVLRSADPHSIEGDYPQASDFRQDNDFFYLTGLETAESWLVLIAREDAPDRTVLYLPARDRSAERWTGRELGPGAEATRLTGISEVRPADDAIGEIRARVRDGGGTADGGLPLYVDGVDPDRAARLFGRPAASLAPHLGRLRLVKDAEEMRRLRRAIEITGEAQREAMRAASPGMWEYEIEALIEYTFRRNGAERVGFPSIVGSGPNSTVLHYDESRRRTDAGDLVVMDIGAEFGYYSADITRTVPVSGRFTPRQRALYELVLGAQQAAIDAIRPGVTIAELSRIARAYMRDHSGSLCGGVTCDRRFVHGLSHWLGMDVHDVGRYDTTLAPGMVLTVEPGVYLPDEGIGIRIEDDVLVTRDGAEVLSEAAPRAPDAIEALMRESPRCCRTDASN